MNSTDLIEQMTREMANATEPQKLMVSRFYNWLIIWETSPTVYAAITRLFNEGYRGDDLRPPPDWRPQRVQ